MKAKIMITIAAALSMLILGSLSFVGNTSAEDPYDWLESETYQLPTPTPTPVR